MVCENIVNDLNMLAYHASSLRAKRGNLKGLLRRYTPRNDNFSMSFTID
jgi:hypothetical protein